MNTCVHSSNNRYIPLPLVTAIVEASEMGSSSEKCGRVCTLEDFFSLLHCFVGRDESEAILTEVVLPVLNDN